MQIVEINSRASSPHLICLARRNIEQWRVKLENGVAYEAAALSDTMHFIAS